MNVVSSLYQRYLPWSDCSPEHTGPPANPRVGANCGWWFWTRDMEVKRTRGHPLECDRGALKSTTLCLWLESSNVTCERITSRSNPSRTKDIELSLKDRVQFANRVGADVFVSMHLNSTENPGPKGHASFALAAESSDEATRRLVEFENREPVSIKKHSEDEKDEAGVSDILLDLTRSGSDRLNSIGLS